VDRAGDGFLASFESVHAAVECAIDVQRGLLHENMQRRSAVPMNVRIGIGAGEPVRDGEALFGTTINLTARVCNCAEPGQILVPDAVRTLCLGAPFTFQRLGVVDLMGFDEPVQHSAVDWRAQA
jgi:class 3 adenylate cyclase